MHSSRVFTVLVISITFILVACGGQSPSTTPAPGPDQADLPALSELKAGAKLVETTVNGTATYSRNGDVTDDNDDLVLNSVTGTLSWGIWQLSSPDTVEQVTIEFGTPVGDEAWVGLADYSQNHWVLFGPYDASEQLTLVPSQHDNGSGSFFVALLVYDGNTATVGSLTLTADHLNTGPLAVLDADVTSGADPLEVTFDATGSIDADGSIVNYEWDFDGDGTYDASGSAATTVHSYETPGNFASQVKVTDDEGLTDTATLEIIVKASPVADLAGDPLTGVDSLEVTFDATGSSDADGSIVDYEWDFDGDGTYDDSGSEPTTIHSYATSGSFTAEVKVTDNDGFSDTATVEININATPVADLTGNPLSGDDTLHVTFDATGSSDADGSIVDYEWDFDGNSTYNEPGAEADNQGIDTPPAQEYTTGAPVTVGLRVTDDDGLTDTTSVIVTVHGWDVQTLDSTAWVGEHTSFSMVDGNPAVSYYDQTNGDLKYVRATNASGSTWSTPLVLDTAGQVGQYTSLSVVDGNPAISYYDYTNGGLKYVRATDASGSSWGTPITVDATGNTGIDTSLAVVDGNPAISYYTNTGNDLKYVRATDASGNTWGAPQTIDADDDVGKFSSLCVVDGNPAISYHDAWPNYALKYVRATDTSGSSWGTPLAVDTTDEVGAHTSLCVVDGNPAISYFDSTNIDLKFVRATDASGSTWDTPQALDAVGEIGEYTSLCVVDGNPAISYYDATNSDLKYIRASNASGSTWGTPQALDTAGRVGEYSSLAVVDGYPAISYHDSTNGNLKFVRLY